MSAIPTELRRSALCDADPMCTMNIRAWEMMMNWRVSPSEAVTRLPLEDQRIFILLVSYAVESEP